MEGEAERSPGHQTSDCTSLGLSFHTLLLDTAPVAVGGRRSSPGKMAAPQCPSTSVSSAAHSPCGPGQAARVSEPQLAYL